LISVSASVRLSLSQAPATTIIKSDLGFVYVTEVEEIHYALRRSVH